MIVGDCMQYPNLPDKHLVARARDALTKWLLPPNICLLPRFFSGATLLFRLDSTVLPSVIDRERYPG